MNILHLARTMDQGGAEKIVYQLAAVEKKANNHIVVLSSGGCYVEALESQGVIHKEIPDLDCKTPRVVYQIFKILIKTVREEHIDIIHTHHRMAAFYARLVKLYHKDIRLIYTAHNVFFNRKKLTAFALSDSEIVAVGKSVKDNLESVFGIAPERIRIIYNAASNEEPVHRVTGDIFEKPDLKKYRLVGTIGRLSEQKGIDIFIQSFVVVKKNYPDVKGIIIGDGELREKLQQMIDQVGMSNDIMILGYRSDVIECIKHLEFVVMPSRWEGFPLTPIEVFSAQKTIIGSNIGGINEIIVHGDNGLLVEKDDIQGFSEAMIKLLEDSALRKKLELNAKEYFDNNFDFDSFVKQYEQLYSECCN
ncbi:MAG: glycosyltransferase family 4 protein [Lachnospiraceae bacterium]